MTVQEFLSGVLTSDYAREQAFIYGVDSDEAIVVRDILSGANDLAQVTLAELGACYASETDYRHRGVETLNICFATEEDYWLLEWPIDWR